MAELVGDERSDEQQVAEPKVGARKGLGGLMEDGPGRGRDDKGDENHRRQRMVGDREDRREPGDRPRRHQLHPQPEALRELEVAPALAGDLRQRRGHPGVGRFDFGGGDLAVALDTELARELGERSAGVDALDQVVGARGELDVAAVGTDEEEAAPPLRGVDENLLVEPLELR